MPLRCLLVVAAVLILGGPSSASQLASQLRAQKTVNVPICIVGAGPGGLQVAHSLAGNGSHDFLVFERTHTPGSYFVSYPRHRRLISLNKRFTGRSNPEFNLRHDWNSLLDQPDVAPMTNRTKERWPPADTLVEYLRDFAQEQVDAGRVVFGATIDRIERQGMQEGSILPGDHHGDFNVAITLRDEGVASAETAVRAVCGAVVVATGLPNPHVPDVPGIELAEGYEDQPETGEAFEGLAVAVLGMGNSGLETYDALANHAAYVHVLPGRGRKKRAEALSWESKYVGDIRVINAGLLDSYLLKSLDGGVSNGLTVARPERQSSAAALSILRCGKDQTQFCLFTAGPTYFCRWPDPTIIANVSVVNLGQYDPSDPWAAAFLKRLGDNRVFEQEAHWQEAQRDAGAGEGGPPSDSGQGEYSRSPVTGYIDIQPSAAQRRAGNAGTRLKIKRRRMATVMVEASYLTPETIDDCVEFTRRGGGGAYPLRYDRVIRALGWRPDRTIFDLEPAPLWQGNDKYPMMTHEYESRNVPGLYFAGCLSHGKDFKRAAGGFIHGFRYTARALARILDQKYYGTEWPKTVTYAAVENWANAPKEDANLDHWGPCPTCETPPIPPSNHHHGGVGGAASSALVGLDAVVARIMERIDTSSGLYQMVGVLGDGVVFRCPGDAAGVGARKVTATYIEEAPLEYFHRQYSNRPRVTVGFGFDGQHRTFLESTTAGTRFQAFLWYFPGDCRAATDGVAAADAGGAPPASAGKMVLRLEESVHTEWDGWINRANVGGFLHEHILQMAAPAEDCTDRAADVTEHRSEPDEFGLSRSVPVGDNPKNDGEKYANRYFAAEGHDKPPPPVKAHGQPGVDGGFASAAGSGAQEDRVFHPGRIEVGFANNCAAAVQLQVAVSGADQSASFQIVPAGGDIKFTAYDGNVLRASIGTGGGPDGGDDGTVPGPPGSGIDDFAMPCDYEDATPAALSTLRDHCHRQHPDLVGCGCSCLTKMQQCLAPCYTKVKAMFCGDDASPRGPVAVLDRELCISGGIVQDVVACE